MTMDEEGIPTPDSEKDQSRRPTPVRMVMESAKDESEPHGTTTRTFWDGGSGREWVVTVVGRSASGVLPLRSVSLMELCFAWSEAPDRPLRSVIHTGAHLDGLSDEEILGCFQRSEPYREASAGPAKTDRKGRKRKGRESAHS